MKKIMTLLVVSTLLVGCNQDNVSQNDLDDLSLEVAQMKEDIQLMNLENKALSQELSDLQVSLDALEIKAYTSMSDYMNTFSYDLVLTLDTLSEQTARLSNYNPETQEIQVSPIEYIYTNDQERIDALGIDVSQVPQEGDVYVYTHEEASKLYKLHDHLRVYVWNTENMTLVEVPYLTQLSDEDLYDSKFDLFFIDDEIIRITEKIQF